MPPNHPRHPNNPDVAGNEAPRPATARQHRSSRPQSARTVRSAVDPMREAHKRPTTPATPATRPQSARRHNVWPKASMQSSKIRGLGKDQLLSVIGYIGCHGDAALVHRALDELGMSTEQPPSKSQEAKERGDRRERNKGWWRNKAAGSVKGARGTTSDPCKMPAGASAVRRQREAMCRLSQPSSSRR